MTPVQLPLPEPTAAQPPFTVAQLQEHIAAHPEHERGLGVVWVYDMRGGRNEVWIVSVRRAP